ncbi:MAG: response regulator [Desulforhopalus sp.]|nr:response regulator [Desulforhopalus sp.]
MKILIVDDDAIVVQSCIRILELEGIKASSAGSVEMGAKLLSAEGASASFDLILTDVKMPGQDGFEMIRQAREIQPAIPIIMMTGYLTTRTMEKGCCYAADNYIAKPFTPDELIDAVRKTTLRQKGETGK